jgi:hypothetical protein
MNERASGSGRRLAERFVTYRDRYSAPSVKKIDGELVAQLSFTSLTQPHPRPAAVLGGSRDKADYAAS